MCPGDNVIGGAARPGNGAGVADLEAQAERAAEEEGAQQAQERAAAMGRARDCAAAKHWPEMERQPLAPATSWCQSRTWTRVPALGPPAFRRMITRAPSSSLGLGERAGEAGTRYCLRHGAMTDMLPVALFETMDVLVGALGAGKRAR